MSLFLFHSMASIDERWLLQALSTMAYGLSPEIENQL